MQHVQPGLQQCSTQALCNLVWAAGMISASKISGKSVRGTSPAVKPTNWAITPAGLATAATAVAGAAELALRSPQMKPAELASVAVALAGHGAEAAEVLPEAVLVTLRSACAAAAEELALPELAQQLTSAAARLRWVERGLVDSLARAIQARLSLHVCRSEVGALSCCKLGSPQQLLLLHSRRLHPRCRLAGCQPRAPAPSLLRCAWAAGVFADGVGACPPGARALRLPL